MEFIHLIKGESENTNAQTITMNGWKIKDSDRFST